MDLIVLLLVCLNCFFFFNTKLCGFCSAHRLLYSLKFVITFFVLTHMPIQKRREKDKKQQLLKNIKYSQISSVAISQLISTLHLDTIRSCGSGSNLLRSRLQLQLGTLIASQYVSYELETNTILTGKIVIKILTLH